jgi:hypothetical protein
VRKNEHVSKLCMGTDANIREEAWWSRRVASGSDWMDAWISKPTRR